MTKELFVSCINALQKYDEWEQKCCELGICFWEREELCNLINSYIDLLNHACKAENEDPLEPSAIQCFIYDYDFGKNADHFYITLTDGTKVDWSTAEDLWDYLVKKHPEIDEH